MRRGYFLFLQTAESLVTSKISFAGVALCLWGCTLVCVAWPAWVSSSRSAACPSTCVGASIKRSAARSRSSTRSCASAAASHCSESSSTASIASKDLTLGACPMPPSTFCAMWVARMKQTSARLPSALCKKEQPVGRSENLARRVSTNFSR